MASAAAVKVFGDMLETAAMPGRKINGEND
jgi:hypothetical protein